MHKKKIQIELKIFDPYLDDFGPCLTQLLLFVVVVVVVAQDNPSNVIALYKILKNDKNPNKNNVLLG